MKKIHGGDIYSYNNEMVDFSSNISPLGIQPEIYEAAKKALLSMDKYPDVECRRLRQALSVKEDLPMENIICGNGAAEIIFNLVAAIRPKKALVIGPSFAEYENSMDSLLVDKVYYYLKEENDFLLTEDILDYLTEDIDLLFICNPNNPTGRLVDSKLLDEIGDKCRNNDIFLVIDECFLDFCKKGESLSMVAKLKDNPKLVILKAFTKIYAMAGLRLGYALTCNENLIDGIYTCRQPWSVSLVAEEAGIAALKLVDLPAKTASYVEEERKRLKKEISGLGIKVFDSDANFLLLKTDIKLDEGLVRENILVRNATNFPGLGSGYYRIAVKSKEENIKLIAALERLVIKDGKGNNDTGDNV